MPTQDSFLPAFDDVPPRQPRLLERLLRRPLPLLAEQAIAAELKRIGPFALSDSMVGSILRIYNVRGSAMVKQVTESLVSRALKRFIEDDVLSEPELKYLERMCRILDVGFDLVEGVKSSLIHPRYQKAVSEAVEDGLLTPRETEFLERLRSDLRLPPEIASQLSMSAKENVVARHLADMVSDRRVSPTELADLASLSANLDIPLEMAPDLQSVLSRFATLWRIENGNLPEMSVEISLQKGEMCHFSSACEWHELRTKTRRIDYAGPVAYIPIMKGFRYRIGSITPHRVATEEMTHIDDGILYITSKRAIFTGRKRNVSFRLSSLLGVEAFSDGLSLQKATGRNPHFILQGDVELALVVLTTLLSTA